MSPEINPTAIVSSFLIIFEFIDISHIEIKSIKKILTIIFRYHDSYHIPTYAPTIYMKIIVNPYTKKNIKDVVEYTCDVIHSHEMSTAHVIIKCKQDFETQLIERLEKIENMTDIHRTIGMFDLLVKIEAVDDESLKRIIRWKIYHQDYIESITTLPCTRKPLCIVMK